MKNVLDEIKIKAKALQKTIVLCEGEDSRVVKAAADSVKEGVAKIVLLGNEADIKAKNPDVDLSGVIIVDPLRPISAQRTTKDFAFFARKRE